MKELMIVFCVLISITSEARELNVEFDTFTEQRCAKEVVKLECGTPELKKENDFLDCVERKVSLLSPDCKKMYSFISKNRRN